MTAVVQKWIDFFDLLDTVNTCVHRVTPFAPQSRRTRVMSEVHRNMPCVKCAAPVALDKYKLGDLFDYGNVESECLYCGTVNQILLRHRVSPRENEATDE